MIKIERINNINDSDLTYDVYINNLKLHSFKNGESKQFDLINGDYEIYVKSSDFIKSLLFFMSNLLLKRMR